MFGCADAGYMPRISGDKGDSQVDFYIITPSAIGSLLLENPVGYSSWILERWLSTIL